MSEPKKCCPCCGNRYEQGGGCDCDRNIQRIAALEGELAHSQRVASGAVQLVKTLEADRERDEERERLRKGITAALTAFDAAIDAARRAG